jgi:competence protein ComEC
MLNSHNRAQKRATDPARASLPPGAPRSTRILPEMAHPASEPLNISVLPDLRGLLLVALAAAWLVGIALENWAGLPLWALLLGAGVCTGLAMYFRWLDLLLPLARWLLLGWILLACAALGAGRLALASPVGDPAAVSSFIGRGTVVIDGTISTEPDLRARSTLLEVDASSLSLDNGHTWQNVHGTLAVVALGTGGPYAPDYGDSVEVSGVLEPVVGGPVPSAASASSKVKPLQPVAAPAGVFAAMLFPRLTIQDRGGGNPVLAWLFAVRQSLAQAISHSLPEPEASLLIGILLGLKTTVLRDQYALFQASGTVHLIVASGFKVTVLCGVLRAVANRLVGRRWALAPLLLGILVYTLLSGASPSAIRAGIMGMLLVIAPRLGRAYNVYTALAAAALLMSIWSPYVLWDVGFQLSLLGTLGIARLAPAMARWLARPLDRLPGGRIGAELLAVTIAAQLATLPIQALNFGQLSLVAPLTNLLVVPLLEALLGMGLLTGLLGSLIPIAGAAIGWVCWPLLWLVYQIVTRSAALPFSSVSLGGLNVPLAWLYELGLGLIVAHMLTRPRSVGAIEPLRTGREQSRRARQIRARWRLAGAVFLIAAAGITTLATLPDHRLHITWLDVGPHGQAMLIQTPTGHTVLLDGGDDPAALEEALGQSLPFWQRRLDLVLLTNPRTGHLLGLLDVITHYQIAQAADAGMLHPSGTYASWRATLEQRGIPYAKVRAGASIQIEPGVTFQVLSPGAVLSQDAQNEDTNALIVRLVTPGLRVLFLGETDEVALNHLAASGADLRADIVQVALRADQAPADVSAFATLLPMAQPSLLVVTPASATTRSPAQPSPAVSEPIRTFTIASTGTLMLSADSTSWWLDD